MNPIQSKSIQATIEFLSPVHVGSGEVIEPNEYFIKEGHLHKLNMPRFIQQLPKDKLNSFLKGIDEDNLVMLRTFPADNAKSESVDFKIPVSKTIIKEYNEKVRNLNNRLEIHLFPLDGIRRTPYLPGSSLKGAFRTGVVDVLTQKLSPQIVSEFVREHRSFESKILRYERDIRKDIFKVLKLPDITLESGDTEIVDCYNFKPHKGMSNTFDQRMEVTYSKVSRPNHSKKYPFQFVWNDDLMIAGNLPIKFTLNDIGNYCNIHYFQILRYEMKKFFSGEKKSPMLETLNTLKLNPDQFLIRLGRFGHVESKTVDKHRNPKVRWDHKHNKSYGWGRTRTLANDQYPLGWAIITIPGMQFAAIPDNLSEPTGIGGGYKEDTRIVKEATSNNPQTPRGNENRSRPQQGGGYNQGTKKDFGNKSNPSSPQTGSGHFNQLKNINKDKKK